MTNVFREKRSALSFLLPGLLVYTVVVFFPILWSVFHGFFQWDGFGEKKFVGFANYIKLFTKERNFWSIFTQTFVYTGLQILFQVGGGLLLAILLAALVRGRSFFQAVFYIPVIISSVAICQIFGKLFSVSPTGIVNEFLGLIKPEWKEIGWLTTPKLSLFICAFVEGYKTMGTYMVIFYSALISVPNELLEAGTIDGTNSFQTLIYIRLPYIMNIVVANVVLVLNNSFRSFDIPFLLTSGGPGTTSELLASFMYKKSFSSMQYGYGSAIATVIIIICFILAFFCMKAYDREDS